MEQEEWDELSAALLLRTGWSWQALCETPLSVVDALLVHLRAQKGGSQ